MLITLTSLPITIDQMFPAVRSKYQGDTNVPCTTSARNLSMCGVGDRENITERSRSWARFLCENLWPCASLHNLRSAYRITGRSDSPAYRQSWPASNLGAFFSLLGGRSRLGVGSAVDSHEWMACPQRLYPLLFVRWTIPAERGSQNRKPRMDGLCTTPE